MILFYLGFLPPIALNMDNTTNTQSQNQNIIDIYYYKNEMMKDEELILNEMFVDATFSFVWFIIVHLVRLFIPF